ncbi:hypothetical protein WR25_11253 [Diploscapter pachys]|uniref:CUB domain-containing protein n=1 Tax=Diploscapter pachys TaxID=2018661 RepID=A0A2A2KNS5_9BILA|nr:hypothetical protein WR25_11253 [Diploscapter pachys]
MDHHAVKKTLRTNSSTVVTLQSTGGGDGFPHSGVHGKIVEYNLKDPKFFDCNQTVVLNSSETFFLVSHNYPGTPLDFSPCTVTFQYSEGIRLALYDLVTMNTEIFTIQGTALNGTDATINYSGRFTTYDEPVPLYFQKSVTISFKFENAATFYARRFYILVNAFTITKASSDPCNNPRHFPLQLGEVVLFGTLGYPTQTYSSNADSMSYESEKCCDTMSINGLSPYNDVYQGSQSSFLLFAASSNVTMRFTSDGIIEGTGFSASAYLFDCSCGNTNIVFNSSTTSSSILSPGKNYGISYCPNMDCTYTINFPDDQYEVTAQYEGNIISRSIQLSDSNQFADISTGGFKSDAEATYEFKISTDAEKVITIYFFTLVSGQVKVDLYDGSSTSSNLIDNKILYSNVHTEGESLPLRSTGSSMVVRVRCNTDYDRNCGHDFQAMVSSSAQQDSSCGPMVYSLKNETESKDIPLRGSNCVLILHSTDSSYDPGKVMQLKISSDKLKSLKVFKGLHFNENKYLLSSGFLESIPQSIYDHYVVVQYSASSSTSITLKYFALNFDYLSIYTINNNQSVTFMSKDYLSDTNIGKFDQQFSVENLDATLTRGNLRLVVLNSVGDASGSIEVDNYDEIVAQKS